MQHTNTSSMSGDSTTSLFCRDLGTRWLTTRREGHSNGWAKGLGKMPRSKYGYLGSSRSLSFQGGVGNVAPRSGRLARSRPGPHLVNESETIMHQSLMCVPRDKGMLCVEHQQTNSMISFAQRYKASSQTAEFIRIKRAWIHEESFGSDSRACMSPSAAWRTVVSASSMASEATGKASAQS